MDAVSDPLLATSYSVRLTILLGLLLAICGLVYLKHIQHPLYQFPGPWSAAWSNAHHCYHYMGGRQPFKLLELHEKYGPVVRTAPNDLSFNTAAAFRDIHNFRPGHETFIKSNWYDLGPFADRAHSIVSERDPGVHGQMRKYLSHAFSDKSLKAQTPLIDKVVDEFIAQIGRHGSSGTGTNMVTWFNLCTFDIIGSLALGESFGGVEFGKVHPWIAVVISAVGQAALADMFLRFPLIAKLFRWTMPGAIAKMVKDTKYHEKYVEEVIQKRLSKPSARPDFLTRILENRPADLADVQIAAHASDFVIAGSETTATTLSCIVYYLTTKPDVYKRAADEIRTSFENYQDITPTAAAQLEYLRAVALEAMRMFPPLPLALPRVVPNGGDIIAGEFVPEGVTVSVNPVAASLSAQNFERPLEFSPDRWLAQDKASDLEASQPFSMGPRGCLGRNLAWIELGLLLSKMLWTYDLELVNRDVDWLRDSSMAMLWKKPALMIKTTRRAVRP